MRTDNRGRWTLKHADLGPEFMALVKKAALRQGQTVGSFVLDTLRERSQAILKDDEAPAHPPPARLEDVADVLSARLALAVERLVQPPSVPAREARRLRMALRRR